MRQRRALVVAVAVATLLAGCGDPAGVDGNLTNKWGALPVATGFVPTFTSASPRQSFHVNDPRIGTTAIT